MRIPFIFATLCIFFVSCTKIQKLRAKTQYGTVEGTRLSTVGKGKEYVAFRGVPYAKPPVGEYRFAPPTAPNPWENVYDATQPKSTCIDLYEAIGSEDCLYLNVFTPSTNGSLPVIIWIHGGGFAAIFGTYTLDGVDYFMDEDVIVVTIHYRLGPFGFLSTEDSIIPGNFGLKDQLMAVEWVSKNIRNFGGDPTRITLMGQSAGAASVEYLAMNQKLQGKISGVIQQSGSALSTWSLSRQPRIGAYVLGGKLGIQTTDSSILLKELRSKTTEEIRNAAFSTEFELIYGGGTFHNFLYVPVREPPSVDAVFSSMTYEELKKGNFNKVPRIIGINSLEAIYSADEFRTNEKYYKNYDEIIRRYLPVDLNSRDEVAAKSIRDYYFGGESFTANISKLIHYVSDELFVRPIFKDVDLVSPFVKTYVYHFTYEGQLGKTNRTMDGVEHGEELQYLFRADDQGSVSKNDRRIREKLVKLWSNFAKTGNPTPDKDKLFDNQIWIKVDPDAHNIPCFDIGRKINVVQDPHGKDVEFWEKIYSEYGHRPYDTY